MNKNGDRSSNIFPQNVIALIWDFDKTLTPNYMQKPLFEHYGVKSENFWEEVSNLPAFYQQHGLDIISRDTIYLNHMLTYVKYGKFKGLNNQLLRKLGKQIEFYEGLPQFFPLIQERLQNDPRFSSHKVYIEHYIISSGLRQMILGSAIEPYVEDVWACEFVERIPPPGYLLGTQGELDLDIEPEIVDIGYMIDNTTKTRAVFEINKGVNKDPSIDVNSRVTPEDRRVPFHNMIYIADGPSDIPVFSMLNERNGYTYAVYRPNAQAEFKQANKLQQQDRIQSFGEADYTEGSKTFMWIWNAVESIAEQIVAAKKSALDERMGQPPTHI